jgi:hypothetical protein
MKWVGHVAHIGEIRNAHKILVGKPEGKRPFRRLGVGKIKGKCESKVVPVLN